MSVIAVFPLKTGGFDVRWVRFLIARGKFNRKTALLKLVLENARTSCGFTEGLFV
jgi:hypothetical protein